MLVVKTLFSGSKFVVFYNIGKAGKIQFFGDYFP